MTGKNPMHADKRTLDRIATPLGWASWHTRPDAILRLLTYGDFYIRPDRGSTFDHGTGWGEMEVELLGRPLA